MSEVFDTYWRFAAERQHVYESRALGLEGPWTNDPILQKHRFTNCYRAADRVSQFLIRDVVYAGPQDPVDVVFRVLLFKSFNKIETWQLLERKLGEISWKGFERSEYDRALSEAFAAGSRLYSAAYVIPAPRFGAERKHSNHLKLVEHMMLTGVVDRIVEAPSMQRAFEVLRSYPSFGDFLAYQFITDINYSNVVDFDEMDFVVAGPGARDGIRKCFGEGSRGIEAEIIRFMANHQKDAFGERALTFRGLEGRPLQLIDCQNLFCEVDKYARVAHPEISGYSGRSRIKQRFRPAEPSVTAWFPPKWGLGSPKGAAVTELQSAPTSRGRSC